jgi:hypothetical protein
MVPHDRQKLHAFTQSRITHLSTVCRSYSYISLFSYHSYSVCRPEVYRVKATIAAVVSLCSDILHTQRKGNESEHVSRLTDFLPLYKQMLVESYDPHWETYETRTLDGESCDCCGADIWQSAMICTSCSPGAADKAETPHFICGSCYIDGRSCACETMQPVQARPFDELISLANNAVKLLHSNKKNRRGKAAKQFSEKYCCACYPPSPIPLLNFVSQGSHFGCPSTDFSCSYLLVSVSHVD